MEVTRRPVKMYLHHSINTLRRHRQHLAGWPMYGRTVKSYDRRMTRMENQSRHYNIYLARRLGL